MRKTFHIKKEFLEFAKPPEYVKTEKMLPEQWNQIITNNDEEII